MGCETFGMGFVAEAFGGWLVGQVAAAGWKRLTEVVLGRDQERALREGAAAAIQATAQDLRPAPASMDDVQGADHLARVIDQFFREAPSAESLTGHATLLQTL